MPPPHLPNQHKATHTTSASSPSTSSSQPPPSSSPHVRTNHNPSTDDTATPTRSSEPPPLSPSAITSQRDHAVPNGTRHADQTDDHHSIPSLSPALRTSRKPAALLNKKPASATPPVTIQPTSSRKLNVHMLSQSQPKQLPHNQNQHQHQRQSKSQQSRSPSQQQPQPDQRSRSRSRSPSQQQQHSQSQQQPNPQLQLRPQSESQSQPPPKSHTQSPPTSHTQSTPTSQTQSQSQPQTQPPPRPQMLHSQTQSQLRIAPQSQPQSQLQLHPMSRPHPHVQQKQNQSQPQPQSHYLQSHPQNQQQPQVDLQTHPKVDHQVLSPAERPATLPNVTTSVGNTEDAVQIDHQRSLSGEGDNENAEASGGSSACLRVRQGRPPNINENPLIRRLECILSVQTGRMTMANACRAYDISARTFYRWLRDKPRLVQLTGVSEADIRSGVYSPTGLAAYVGGSAKPTLQRLPSRRVPSSMSSTLPNDVPVASEQAADNLPRLPTRPAIPPPTMTEIAPASIAVTPSTASEVASKRRLPRKFAVGQLSQSNMPHISHDGIQPTPSTAFSLRAATSGELSQSSKPASTEPHQSEARAIIPGRPPPLPLTQSQPQLISHPQLLPEIPAHSSQPVHSSLPQSAQPGLLDAATMTPVAMQNSESISLDTRDPSSRAAKRLKLQLTAAEKALQERNGLLGAETAATSEANVSDVEAAPFRVNGYVPSASVAVIPRLQPCAVCSTWQQKRRVVVALQDHIETFAWYAETAANDIKEAIGRRFALPPDTRWALVDAFGDEVIISWTIPSARYTVNIYP